MTLASKLRAVRKPPARVSYMLKAPCSHCGQWRVDDVTLRCSHCGNTHEITEEQRHQRDRDYALWSLYHR